ncbi:MAG: NAD(P) transhydrogenase subunit alpha [Deltaproteobacteria bacterium]|nr:NAD(P) transhydrogenase subunit alpha [Deltaproteobacteria bacterium]
MVGYSTLMPELYVFILAAFVGYMVITRVPPLLHTPLMSATNAISAISVVGAILVAGSANSLVTKILGTIAVAAAMSNVVGGFILTDRMLKMFKKEKR